MIKVEYAVGFLDGLKLGFHFSYWKTSHANPQDECVGKASESYTEYWQSYGQNVTAAQLADGLTVLYDDHRNRKIQLQWGVWLVMKEIAGTPKAEMDSLIETHRRNATKYTYE